MSALNVTQAEADVLVSALSMFAKVHENASGVVPDEVATLLAKLAPEPVAVAEVVAEAPAEEAPPEVEVADEVVADIAQSEDE
mgnify:CR=1 FL=1